MIRTQLRRGVLVGLVALMIGALGGRPGGISAQSAPAYDPVILVVDGDLWAWTAPDQPLTQLTWWGMNEWPVLSPDGTHVAYNSDPKVYADWALTLTGGGGGYWPPQNIWMLDVPTSETYRVADQPAGAVWNGPEVPGNYIQRGKPVWSPDGQQLAWVELWINTLNTAQGDPIGTAQFVTYDLASGTKHVLDMISIPGPYTSPDLFDVKWGLSGIVAQIALDGYDQPWEMRFYDASGNRTSTLALGPDQIWLLRADWIADGGQDYLYSPASALSGKWWNWRTQRESQSPDQLKLVSTSAPDGAVFKGSFHTWQITLPGQTSLDLGDNVMPFGISRDGQQVLYGRRETDPDMGYLVTTVIVHSAAGDTELGRFISMTPVWGPVRWQVAR